MSMDKNKLEKVSFGGFSVENLEVIQDNLRQCLSALHKGQFGEALAVAHTLHARSESLIHQCSLAYQRKGGR